MAQVLVRNLDGDVVARLKAQAADENLSLEQFLRDLLTKSTKPTISKADHDLAAPDLFTAEFANTLWKYVRADLMPLDSAKLGHHYVMSAITITANPDLVDRALDLSAELQHSAYDCFYVALAEREACPLITADKELMRKLKAQSTMSFLSLYEY